MAPAASCREGTKRPADSNKFSNDILTKCQDRPCENRANGRGIGTGRKCANLVRPGNCRMKAESRFPRHFAARPGTPCGRNPLPRVSPARGMAGKRTNEVCTRTDSIQSGKSPPKPCFSLLPAPAGTALRQKKFRLCGRRFVSLRKAILFLSRKNTRRDGEMLHTDSSFTRFLTLRLLLAAGRPVIETRKRKENLSS